MSGTPKIKRALTAAEWADSRDLVALPDGGGYVGIRESDRIQVSFSSSEERDDLYAKDRHALAALCLHEQPFGFTHDDVTLLWGIAHHFQASTGDRAYSDRIGSLAERIAALLPPAP